MPWPQYERTTCKQGRVSLLAVMCKGRCRCRGHRRQLPRTPSHLVLVLTDMLGNDVANLPEAHPWAHRCNGLVQRLHAQTCAVSRAGRSAQSSPQTGSGVCM